MEQVVVVYILLIVMEFCPSAENKNAKTILIQLGHSERFGVTVISNFILLLSSFCYYRTLSSDI